MATELFEDAAGSVDGLLAATARRLPAMQGAMDTAAGEHPLTFAELDRAVDARARELVAVGLAAGDRAAIARATSLEFVIDILAAVRVGGVAVPLAPQLDATSTRALLEHCGAKVLSTSEGAPAGLPPDLRVLGTEPRRDIPADLAAVPSAAGGEDLAMIAYVAGVDSPPRGVMYSHRALLANVAQLRRVLPESAAGRERVLLASPLAHVYGLVAGLLPAISAGWSVLLPAVSGIRAVLADCAAQRATLLVATAAVYTELSALADAELGEGLATVSTLLCGPSPTHSRVHAAVRRATGLDIAECYGRAEVAGVLTSTLGGAPAEPGSVGPALPGSELRLVDSAGADAPIPLDPADPDDVFSDDGTGTGLVAVRGPSLCSGYWPDGEYGPDPQGWARTGDVGYVDTGGDLHLIDRASDLILVDGFNVYPHEIEEVVGAMPGVAEVAVVGVREHDRGEVVHAVVVPAPDAVEATVTEERVLEECTAKLPAYKVPAGVRFAAELPRSPTGMLRRNRVRP